MSVPEELRDIRDPDLWLSLGGMERGRLIPLIKNSMTRSPSFTIPKAGCESSLLPIYPKTHFLLPNTQILPSHEVTF